MLFGAGKKKKSEGPAAPGEAFYQKAREAEKKDKTKALRLYEKAAGMGHMNAAYCCGRQYDMGLGTEKDPKKALAYFQQAAEQGDKYAQNACGKIYHRGKGIPIDLRQALEWYERAAEQGLPEAQWACTDIYGNERGPIYNPQKALYWYTKLANAPGSSSLALYMCAKLNAGLNKEVPADWGAAHEWLRRCKAYMDYKKDETFRSNVDWVANWLAIEEEKEAATLQALLEKGEAAWEAAQWEEAEEAYLQAAEQGDVEAMAQLGRLYEKEGTGFQDFDKYVQWTEKAAELGDVDAMRACMERESHREHGKWDFPKLLYWAEKLADIGDGQGCYMAGLLYYDWNGVEPDLNKAHEYLAQAANKKVKGAMEKYLEVHFKLMDLENHFNIF